MKLTIITILCILTTIGQCFAQTNQFADGLDLTIKISSEPPSVSLKEAIVLADEFIKTKRINTTGFWMREVKLLYSDGKNVKSKRWCIQWVSEAGGLGNQISLFVDMDKRVWRVGSM